MVDFIILLFVHIYEQGSSCPSGCLRFRFMVWIPIMPKLKTFLGLTMLTTVWECPLTILFGWKYQEIPKKLTKRTNKCRNIDDISLKKNEKLLWISYSHDFITTSYILYGLGHYWWKRVLRSILNKNTIISHGFWNSVFP